MRKLLILMLVFGIASMANAALTIEVRDATGTSAITEIDTGQTFTVVLGGLVSDFGSASGYFRLYDNYESFGGTDYFDFVSTSQPTRVDNGSGYDAAGNLAWTGPYDATYDGYESTADQIGDEIAANDGIDGDWFIYQAVAGSNLGTGTVGLLNSSYSAFLESDTITIIPEPMTVALLGLGGLFLRRRK